MVDRAFLVNALHQAQKHIEMSDRHIARQTELVAELDRDGHDTTMARKLLAKFQDLRQRHIETQNRLMNQLAADRPGVSRMSVYRVLGDAASTPRA